MQRIKELHYSKDFSVSVQNISSLLSEFRQHQVFTMIYEKKKISVASVLQFKNDSLNLLAYTPMGLSMFEAEFKNGKLSYKAPRFLPNKFRPDSVLFDIILIYSDYVGLKSSVSNDVRVEQEKNKRFIYVKNKKIIIIEYLPTATNTKQINFDNLQKNYKFYLQVKKEGFDE